MARYLLDTNIIGFLVSGDKGNISDETKNILSDYNNQLFTSTISIAELIQLLRLKKIQSKTFKNSFEVLQAI